MRYRVIITKLVVLTMTHEFMNYVSYELCVNTLFILLSGYFQHAYQGIIFIDKMVF